MFLDFEDSSRHVFTNGNIIGKTMQYPVGATQRGQHTLGYISSERFVKCQSYDFIVTAHTCTGNVSPSEIP